MAGETKSFKPDQSKRAIYDELLDIYKDIYHSTASINNRLVDFAASTIKVRTKMKNYNGVIDELINGTWVSPSDQNQYGIPIKNIQILESVEGLESGLINKLHDNQKLLVVSDPFTHKAMGEKIFKNLTGKVNVDEYIWENHPQVLRASII